MQRNCKIRKKQAKFTPLLAKKRRQAARFTQILQNIYRPLLVPGGGNTL